MQYVLGYMNLIILNISYIRSLAHYGIFNIVFDILDMKLLKWNGILDMKLLKRKPDRFINYQGICSASTLGLNVSIKTWSIARSYQNYGVKIYINDMTLLS